MKLRPETKHMYLRASQQINVLTLQAISTTIKLSDDSGPDVTVAYKVQDNETHPNHCPNVIAPNECANVKVKEGDSGRKHPVDFEVNVTANANNCNSDAKKNQRYVSCFQNQIIIILV